MLDMHEVSSKIGSALHGAHTISIVINVHIEGTVDGRLRHHGISDPCRTRSNGHTDSGIHEDCDEHEERCDDHSMGH